MLKKIIISILLTGMMAVAIQAGQIGIDRVKKYQAEQAQIINQIK